MALSAEMLILSRSIADLKTLADWLDARVADLALPPKAAFALCLCVEEAVMNSFYHGVSDEVGDHVIKVWAGLQNDAPAAWVEDDGPPFDPVKAQLPEKPIDLASAAVGGSGLRLIRHFAKQLKYRRLDSINRLELVFETA